MPGLSPEIKQAASLLRNGGVVAFPTETVYGLGALAMNPEAVQRLFVIKGQPADQPLIVHLASAEWMEEWARDIPDTAHLLAETFWPGPLTLVLQRQPWVPDAITGGQDSIALRVPEHPVALNLISASGALAVPSANRFGHISPTTVEHVRAELGNAVDMILDGGPCQTGVESTIVSLLDGKPVLLRPGRVSVAEIEKVLGMPLDIATRPDNLHAPSMVAPQYAPHTPLEVLTAPDLWLRVSDLTARGLKAAVMGIDQNDMKHTEFSNIRYEAMPPRAADYAQKLYATLRALDSDGFHCILAETPPDNSEWLAIRDRLAHVADISRKN